MHIDYRENTAENTQQQYKRVKFIINHFNNRFYEEYILALQERHQYDVRKFNNESKLCVNDVVLIQEENRPRVKWRKGKISKLPNSKDGLVRGVELVVNKGMSNKAITIGRPVQHLIRLEMSFDCKNEVSIELNESQEGPAEELDHCNDTDRTFEKRKSRRTAAINAVLMRRLDEENQKEKKKILILHQKRKCLPLIFNTLSKWGSVKDICELIR